MMCLSWCGRSIHVTSNARWDKSHGTRPWADTLSGQTPPLGQIPPGRHPNRQTPPTGILRRHSGLAGTPPHGHSACWDTVNKRAVCIPLECILVLSEITKLNISASNKGSIVRPVHQSNSLKNIPKESITNIIIKQEGLSVECQPPVCQ